jgi:DNA-binding Lrp family transcriptional regulator
MLIHDPKVRAERAAEKQEIILRFLRDEIYTTSAILGELLNCGERSIRKTVSAMEREGLIKRHSVIIYDQVKANIVGITPAGQGLAFDPEKENIRFVHCDPGRVAPTKLQHNTDLQRLRIRAIGLFKQWINSDRLQTIVKKTKKPDAVCLTIKNERVAVEVERNVKSRQRYELFIAAHYAAIKGQKWHRVIVCAQDIKLASRVRKALESVKTVVIAGDKIKTDDFLEKHFVVCTYEDFNKVI